MGDGQHRAGVVLQELLQPQHALGVQVVGRLVKQQQVGRLEQQAAQGHAAPLAARKDIHRRIGVGALQRIHGLGKLAVQVPAVGRVYLVLQLAHLLHERVVVGVGVGHLLADGVEARHLGYDVGEGLLDVLAHRGVLIQRRLLLQDAHRVARRQTRLAVADLFQASHHLEQRRLARAVGAHHAYLGARVEGQRHVVEYDLVVVGLARPVHGVDEFRHGSSFCVLTL